MSSGVNLSFKALNSLLLVQVAGEYLSYEQSLTALRQIAERCRIESCVGFLVDSTGMTGRILNVDRFRLMLTLARMFPPQVSVALLVTGDRHIPDYLLETLFRKYGIDGAEFVDRDAAIAWLNRKREPAQEAV